MKRKQCVVASQPRRGKCCMQLRRDTEPEPSPPTVPGSGRSRRVLRIPPWTPGANEMQARIRKCSYYSSCMACGDCPFRIYQFRPVLGWCSLDWICHRRYIFPLILMYTMPQGPAQSQSDQFSPVLFKFNSNCTVQLLTSNYIVLSYTSIAPSDLAVQYTAPLDPRGACYSQLRRGSRLQRLG